MGRSLPKGASRVRNWPLLACLAFVALDPLGKFPPPRRRPSAEGLAFPGILPVQAQVSSCTKAACGEYECTNPDTKESVRYRATYIAQISDPVYREKVVTCLEHPKNAAIVEASGYCVYCPINCGNSDALGSTTPGAHTRATAFNVGDGEGEAVCRCGDNADCAQLTITIIMLVLLAVSFCFLLIAIRQGIKLRHYEYRVRPYEETGFMPHEYNCKRAVGMPLGISLVLFLIFLAVLLAYGTKALTQLMNF